MTLLENQSAEIPAPREITTKPRVSDKIFRGIVTAGGLSSLVILGLIFAFLLYQGFDIFKSQGLKFITTSRWDVNFDDAGNIVSSDFGLPTRCGPESCCPISHRTINISRCIRRPCDICCAYFLDGGYGHLCRYRFLG